MSAEVQSKRRNVDGATCDICNREFILKSSLKRHWKRYCTSAHLKNEIPVEPRSCCDDCSSSYAKKDHLADHILSKHKVTPSRVNCDNCQHYSTRKSALILHNWRFHLGKLVRSNLFSRKTLLWNLFCDECGKNFRADCKRELLLHYGRCHSQGTSAPAGTDALVCDDCGYQSRAFARKRFLAIHSLRRHGKASLARLLYRPDSFLAYTCDLCRAVLAGSSSMILHWRVRHTDHRSQVRSVCDFCLRTFFSKAYLEHHIKILRGSGSLDAHLNPLKRHLSGAESSKSPCSNCGKRLQLAPNALQSAVSHVQYCLNIRPFACTSCGCLYSNKRLVRNHMKRHCPYGAMALVEAERNSAAVTKGLRRCFPFLDLIFPGFKH